MLLSTSPLTSFYSSSQFLALQRQFRTYCYYYIYLQIVLLAMSPATLRVLCFTFFFAILSIQQCICANSPENSPSPAPESGGDLGSLPPIAAAPKTPSPSPLASVSSPPSPSPTDRSPNSAPAPSPGSGDNATPSPETEPSSPSPAPRDVVASDISHESTTAEVNESSSSDGGMNGGKKAGLAFGVMAAACVVGLGALVYKKRRQNIRRAQFGYAARRDFL